MSNAIIIGEGKMALDCARIAARREGLRLAAVVCPPGQDGARLRRLCEDAEAALFAVQDPNDDQVVAELERFAPDFVFSINNYRLLGPRLLGCARHGALNFHNGPLPRYAGVNIPTWVIWNGERGHGVTWHWLDRGVDTGAIIDQVTFDLSGEETASELTFRCIVEGTNAFPRVLDGLLAGTAAARPQSGERSYFRRRDVPNDGYVEPSWTAGTLRRFLRAMSFRPFPSPFGPLKLRTRGGDLRFETAWFDPQAEPRGAPGTLVEAAAGFLSLATPDGQLRIEHCVDAADRPASAADQCRHLGLSPGAQLMAHPT